MNASDQSRMDIATLIGLLTEKPIEEFEAVVIKAAKDNVNSNMSQLVLDELLSIIKGANWDDDIRALKYSERSGISKEGILVIFYYRLFRALGIQTLPNPIYTEGLFQLAACAISPMEIDLLHEKREDLIHYMGSEMNLIILISCLIRYRNLKNKHV